MNFGSLFSGIGGIDLGLERAGMTCKWQVEIDDYCQQVLAKHWPSVPRLGDVRDVSASTVEAVDLICGGFPCQPVSVAGKRQGQDDIRWLWPEFARVVDELRPRYVLLENVPGLLTNENGAGSEVVSDLASLGYDAEWGCISASAFGTPYRRSRWFCVGSDPESIGRVEGWAQHAWQQGGRNGSGSCICADEPRLEVRQEQPEPQHSPFVGAGWWSAEPDVVRVVYGVPDGVDRIKALGNAHVPQCAALAWRVLSR